MITDPNSFNNNHRKMEPVTMWQQVNRKDGWLSQPSTWGISSCSHTHWGTCRSKAHNGAKPERNNCMLLTQVPTAKSEVNMPEKWFSIWKTGNTATHIKRNKPKKSWHVPVDCWISMWSQGKWEQWVKWFLCYLHGDLVCANGCYWLQILIYQ